MINYIDINQKVLLSSMKFLQKICTYTLHIILDNSIKHYESFSILN